MRQIVLLVHNVRSAHNVGSLLRTADGLGVETVYLTGYSPYPKLPKDKRLPHLIRSAQNKITKTALGAEQNDFIKQSDDIIPILNKLKSEKFFVCALEQNPKSINLQKFIPNDKIALIVGRETEGIEKEVLKSADKILQIQMFGSKESFNVCQAAAMALFHLRFT